MACGAKGFSEQYKTSRMALMDSAKYLRGQTRRGFRHKATNRTRKSQTQVGVDIHLAHAVLDALNDLLHRHAVGFGDFATKLVDDRQPFLGHRR